MVRKLKLSRKTSPAKDRGQRTISSYFGSSSASLFTTVNDDAQRKPTSDGDIKGLAGSSSGSSRSKLTLSHNSKVELSKKTDGNLQDSMEVSSDSDLEIIENTPESKSINKRNMLVDDDLALSPDIIPSTPQIKTVDKSCSLLLPPKASLCRTSKSAMSLLSSRSHGARKNSVIKPKPLSLKSRSLSLKGNNSSLKLSMKSKEPLLSLDNLNKKDIDITNEVSEEARGKAEKKVKDIGKENKEMVDILSLKRSAVSGTGISPDPKRVMTPDRTIEDVKQCKTNLLEKFEGDSPSVRESEDDDGSFSILQGSMMSRLNQKLMEETDDTEVLKPSAKLDVSDALDGSIRILPTRKGAQILKPSVNSDVDEILNGSLEVLIPVKNTEELPKVSANSDVSEILNGSLELLPTGKDAEVPKTSAKSNVSKVLDDSIRLLLPGKDAKVLEPLAKSGVSEILDGSLELLTPGKYAEVPKPSAKSDVNEVLDGSIGLLLPGKNASLDGEKITGLELSSEDMSMDDDKSSIESEVKCGTDLFSVSQEFSTEFVCEDDNKNVKPVVVDKMEAFDDDDLTALFDDELTCSFEKMSPFKKKVTATEAPPMENKIIKALLNESLGESSYSVCGDFGRHIVTEVERRPYEQQILLKMTSLREKESRTCALKGFWAQSAISEGDIVHILFKDHVDGHYTIDNVQGLIVINPDFLISGTSVVSAVFCRRKAVLNERFRGLDSSNQLMLIGSLVHQLFQDVVKEKITCKEKLEVLVRQLMAQPKMLREMYGLGVSEAQIYDEMNNFLPRIHSWSQRYLGSGLVQPEIETQRRNQWQGNILEIQDIEENVWSPKFGVKGKIDLTVKTHYRGSRKIVPLELKTGRSSFSAEHRGQVTLYSMMSADRREDPRAGLLLYLKDGAMEEVPAGEKEKKGLIQLRNEMIHYLTARPIPIEGSAIPKSPSLPEPIDFEKACSRCAHLLTCTVYQKTIEERIPEPTHPMAALIPQTTGHLLQSHLDYFRLWCLLLHLEIGVNKKDSSIRALWCKDAAKRESSGDCISSLILDPSANVEERETGQFLHIFIRSPLHPSSVALEAVGLQDSENVVVSTQKEIALSLGVILNFRNGGVCVVLDRDLKKYPNWRNKIFTLDRCEYQNTMSINFTNLARLLMDSPRAATLRSQIIDKAVPSFKKGLPPDIVTKGKAILKRLNKIQQRAVLKTLMAEDYSLMKGFPGTGKTSTIVALVELMVVLGHSVLLTSYTHSAVDNILLKLKSLEVDFLRLGRVSRIHPDLVPYADEMITSSFKDVASLSEFYSKKLVVASTCLGVNHVIFTKRTFDFCIVDEASQVLQAAALGPLFHASRFVLVGDPQQLPPVIQSGQAKDLGMSESLFARLDEDVNGATSCLTEQYRMNGHIMKLANILMYDGQLRCASSELEMKTLDLPYYKDMLDGSSLADWVKRIAEPDAEHSVVFVDTCGSAPEGRDCANMIINNKETVLVLTLVQTLLKAGLNADDIGVITPYRAQVKNIRNTVTKGVEMGHRVEVNTVDQYQGRDKSVIIYSCVRSGVLRAESGEILQDLRRLNVAVTRAKYKLILIGDKDTLQLYSPFQKLISCLESSQTYKIQEGVDGFQWPDDP